MGNERWMFDWHHQWRWSRDLTFDVLHLSVDYGRAVASPRYACVHVAILGLHVSVVWYGA